MSSYAFAGMLGEGKADRLRRFAAEITGPRKADHDDYLRRYNLVKEYGWIQGTPMGEMYIIYLESTDDFLDDNRKFAASTHPFDVWYKSEVGDILGQDFTRPLPAGFVETLFESHEPWATGRELPTAQAAPVLPGKAETLRTASREVAGSRSADVHESHERAHVSGETWFLEHAPGGDIWIYFNESEDPALSFKEFAQSPAPFDVWSRTMVGDVTGIDYSQMAGALPELVLQSGVGMPAMAGGGRR